jgi:hypothetical protein
MVRTTRCKCVYGVRDEPRELIGADDLECCERRPRRALRGRMAGMREGRTSTARTRRPPTTREAGHEAGRWSGS